MLTPEQWQDVGRQASKIYAQLELEIIEEIANRIASTNLLNAVAYNDTMILQEMGVLYQDIITLVAKYNQTSASQIKEIFETAGVRSISYDDSIYKEAGLNPIPIKQSKSMLQLLQASANKTNANLNNLVLTTVNTSQTAFYNSINKAYLEVTTGVKSYSSAILDAIEEVAKNNILVEYPSGYKTSIENACRMNIVTGVNQTCGKLQEMRAEEMDWDLMELTAHPGARPEHAVWQGQIVSRSGQKGYLSYDDIGYGTAGGFKGVNCRHDWYPFYEGSTRTYNNAELQELKERTVTYNGKKMTVYEANQLQRKMERQIRNDKKSIAGLQGAIKNGNRDLDLKKATQKLENAKLKANLHNSELNNFLKQTKLTKDTTRLAIGKVTNSEKGVIIKAQSKKTIKAAKTVNIKSSKILSLKECKELIEKQGVKFWKDDLAQIDKKLLSDNTKRLNNLINKYPKIQDFIKSRSVDFNAMGLGKREIAVCTTNLDISKLAISLSKSFYKNYEAFIELEEKSFSQFWSMPCSDSMKSVYSITHEFGHFVENMFINDYNKQHLAEFLNMKARALNAKTLSQSKKILRKWNENVADDIAQSIYEIAKNNNSNIIINDMLSEYGKTNSFEFFAECFANLECGKPNELGKALGEYLKKRGV